MSVSPASSAEERAGGGTARTPLHVAIIMDGNGRWAKARGLPRSVGHERGVEALRRTVDAAPDLGIRHLTVFSFSTENWSRPAEEVNALFGLLRLYVKRDLDRLNKAGVRIRVLGLRDGLPEDILSLIELAENQTAANSRLHLNIAFNYGSRAEILSAARSLAADVASGRLSAEDVTESKFAERLMTAGQPDPDLLIRTSGESRVSNFLLWQAAYAEFVFVPTLWPDFGPDDLRSAVETFATRDRRFGALSSGAGG